MIKSLLNYPIKPKYAKRKPPIHWYNPKIPWWLAVIVCLITGVGGSYAQLQQSGGVSATVTFPYTYTSGQTATASSFIGIAGYNGTTVDALKDTSGALNVSVQNSTLAATQSGSWVEGAGGNFVGFTAFPNKCSTTLYESGMALVPSSSTSVTATATCVSYIILANVTSSAATVTVQDQSTNCNSGPCYILDGFTLPGYAQMSVPVYGAKFVSGIKWASGTANAIMGDILGNQ